MSQQLSACVPVQQICFSANSKSQFEQYAEGVKGIVSPRQGRDKVDVVVEARPPRRLDAGS